MNKPKVKLIGEDGNIFNLLAVVRHTLKKYKIETDDEKYQKLWETIYDEVTTSKNYDEALRVLMKYLDLE